MWISLRIYSQWSQNVFVSYFGEYGWPEWFEQEPVTNTTCRYQVSLLLANYSRTDGLHIAILHLVFCGKPSLPQNTLPWIFTFTYCSIIISFRNTELLKWILEVSGVLMDLKLWSSKEMTLNQEMTLNHKLVTCSLRSTWKPLLDPILFYSSLRTFLTSRDSRLISTWLSSSPTSILTANIDLV